MWNLEIAKKSTRYVVELAWNTCGSHVELCENTKNVTNSTCYTIFSKSYPQRAITPRPQTRKFAHLNTPTTQTPNAWLVFCRLKF